MTINKQRIDYMNILKKYNELEDECRFILFAKRINPISYRSDKNIIIILSAVALIIIGIAVAAIADKIFATVPEIIFFLVIAYSIAVLISMFNAELPNEETLNELENDNPNLMKVILFNIFNGVLYLWILMGFLLFTFIGLFIAYYPFIGGLYLYSIHIFLFCFYYHIKLNYQDKLNALLELADRFFILIIIITGFIAPFISWYGAAKMTEKYSMKRGF